MSKRKTFPIFLTAFHCYLLGIDIGYLDCLAGSTLVGGKANDYLLGWSAVGVALQWIDEKIWPFDALKELIIGLQV